jgi:hypothetical protein
MVVRLFTNRAFVGKNLQNRHGHMMKKCLHGDEGRYQGEAPAR